MGTPPNYSRGIRDTWNVCGKHPIYLIRFAKQESPFPHADSLSRVTLPICTERVSDRIRRQDWTTRRGSFPRYSKDAGATNQSHFPPSVYRRGFARDPIPTEELDVCARPAGRNAFDDPSALHTSGTSFQFAINAASVHPELLLFPRPTNTIKRATNWQSTSLFQRPGPLWVVNAAGS